MDFITKAKKDLEKSGIDVGGSAPPRYWTSTGNFVLNKVLSGSFMRGVPQGRITNYSGPSQSGKSFLALNAAREAQKEGAYVVIVDSEHALDDEFVKKIGLNIDPEHYTYVEADTIPQARKIISTIINGYNAEFGKNNPDGDRLMIVLDSLDMLETDTEAENFVKGKTKGDQGQRNKQLKAMLRSFVQAIKRSNIQMITTSQVYRNQDITNGEGIWIVSDAVRYALSQIALLTKLKLRDDDRNVEGIRLKAEGYKTRFTKPYQNVTIEVPYDTGMDPYNGIFDVAKELGIVKQSGAWYTFGEHKFQKKDAEEHLANILVECEKNTQQYLDARLEASDLDLSEGASSRERRAAKSKSRQTAAEGKE